MKGRGGRGGGGTKHTHTHTHTVQTRVPYVQGDVSRTEPMDLLQQLVDSGIKSEPIHASNASQAMKWPEGLCQHGTLYRECVKKRQHGMRSTDMFLVCRHTRR